ncbi:MAG: quinolinate synthase NadA [Clostridiales bacterium]|nr:quinolinate synthase NadA [Clostridiales bacterium]
MIRNIQDEIIKIKRERDICILAHSYQAHEIIEVADFTGDSFQLSVMASKAKQKKIIMCGVRFMAETVKILSPEKDVWLANPVAGCPMAEQMDKELITQVRQQLPDYTVVAYINTTADLKTVCDVCVTSSSAVKIIQKIENDNILFIPDRNLGDYVAKQIPDKNFKFLQGGCPIHAAVTAKDVKRARESHPDALLLVHPECIPSVVELADFVGSTSAIMEYAEKSPAREFIIGTEVSIAEHLQYRCPDKRFYALSHNMVCPNMKITTLMDLYNCLNGDGGELIVLPEETIKGARRCIDEMIRLGQ